MAESPQQDICRRIATIRLEMAGPRGKATFAKKLGLSPSTYEYYEANRVPSADVLVKIARISGVDLRWLLTGEAEAEKAVPADHPILRRAATMLAQHSAAEAPLAAFLDLLAESLKFPPKPAQAEPQAPPEPQTTAEASWIPVLGRSAAGVPQFWAGKDESAGITELTELVARCAKRSAQAQPAQARGDGKGVEQTVQVISLNAPTEEGVTEFVSLAAVKERHGDAFALRIDGDSMSPDIRHGDLVILSPSVPAASGRAAVVQLVGQIGVTCKLYRREGDVVYLAPINEQFPPQSFAAKDVAWALRVLARIRSLS